MSLRELFPLWGVAKAKTRWLFEVGKTNVLKLIKRRAKNV